VDILFIHWVDFTAESLSAEVVQEWPEWCENFVLLKTAVYTFESSEIHDLEG